MNEGNIYQDHDKGLDLMKGEEFILKLCEGYKVLEMKFDGQNWHALLEQTDKTKWKEESEYWQFLYFHTLNELKVRENGFCLMTSYRNQQRKQVVKKFYNEFYKDMFSLERQLKQQQGGKP